MIDLNLARAHLKADDEDVEDALIEQYIASAVSACEGYCNRKFYENATEQTTDFDAALGELASANEQYNTDIATTEDCELLSIYHDRLIRARGDVLRRINGIVIDGTITAAILMMLGHFYRNRQEVVVAQYSGATQLPAGARRILEPYLWIGNLAGGGS